MRLGREGRTELLLPPAPQREGPARRAPVFYNPAMRIDRDVGVSVLTAWGKLHPPPQRAWEMLSATGVRGLRLLVESGAFSGLDSTEAHPEAHEVLQSNCARYADRGARAFRADAREGGPAGPYDYVDLDPYGSPLLFLPAAMTALERGGLLGVTATDLMVLAGPQRKVCERRYGARPVRGWLGPEGGLRILLATLTSAARERGLGLRPILAYVLGHHLRVYGELAPSNSPLRPPVGEYPPAADDGPPLGAPGPYGPMWTGPLFERSFVESLEVPIGVSDPARLGQLLGRWREESAVDVPFAYEANRLAGELGLASPPPLAELLAELRSRGYGAARSHLTGSAFRTTAPRTEVTAAARETARKLGPGSPAIS
ncbi:MAG: hypothetical protein L3K04_01290 [Thermoplasmata archaeon]|nr:hypothetical protein [Thermoplasmata archaeon]MCI4341618.1 hypothetical protein [Thermoplasmata archaeon]